MGREITRRGFLGHAAGAATAVALISSCTGEAEASDPMLELARHWREQSAAYEVGYLDLDEHDNDAIDALAARTIHPVLDRMQESVPTPTTEAGAIEALRLATGRGVPPGEDSMIIHNLTLAALAFLEGRVG